MLEQPTCKLCNHGFKDHQCNELGIWWCEANGGCPCDQFIVDDNDRSGQYDKFLLN